MTEAQKHLIPDNFQTLNAGTSAYHFISYTGEVVGDPTETDETIGFFFKDDNGVEHDLTLQTSIRARQGHHVSVIYVSKNKAELAHAIAWVNHTTGKADYMKGNARSVVGDKVALFFLKAAEATMAAVNGLMGRHGGAVNILILPIMFGFLLFALPCFLIGSVLGLKSGRSVSRIIHHAEHIIESFDPAYAAYAYSKRPSAFKAFLKWTGVIILIFFILLIIAALLGIE